MSLTEDVLVTIVSMFFAAAKCGGNLHQGKTTTQYLPRSAIKNKKKTSSVERLSKCHRWFSLVHTLQ